MQNHRRIGRMTLWVLLLGPLCLAIHAPTARAGAIADSDLLDVRFTFLLANATKSVRPGPPVVFCLPIGNGSCGESGSTPTLHSSRRLDPPIRHFLSLLHCSEVHRPIRLQLFFRPTSTG